MIVDLLNLNLIQLNAEALTREEAIKIAGQLLIDEKKIESRYVDAVIKAMNTMGPYFVLLPGVALPHARSDEGVLETALAIVTLKTPVKFNANQNDPVKYIIMLSAKNNSSHLNALAHLAELFENKSFFDILDNSKSPQKVLDYLSKYTNKEEVTCIER